MIDAAHRRAPGVVWRVHRGSVLVARTGHAPQQLDGGAALVWLALPGAEVPTAAGATVRSLVEGTADRWPDPGEAEVQVREALELLVASGLVSAATADPGAQP